MPRFTVEGTPNAPTPSTLDVELQVACEMIKDELKYAKRKPRNTYMGRARWASYKGLFFLAQGQQNSPFYTITIGNQIMRVKRYPFEDKVTPC